MKMKKEIDFVFLLQDSVFLERVKNSNGIENQLDILEKDYPGKRREIALALEFLNINLSDQKRMPLNEVDRIWQNIREYMGQNVEIGSKRFIGFKVWTVAAALIILFASSVITYQWLTKNDSLEKMASVETKVDKEAMIILSDGSKHKLSVKDTHIEYRSDGGEVIVKNDKQEEKIENAVTSVANINQIVVPYGHRHILTLSDGTKIHLNSGSRLVFPAEFQDKKREVYLKGEGYFEVSKNPEKPFIVKTDFVNIQVLGTVFNIAAYEDEQMTTAVLVEGKVVVSQKNKLFGYTEKKLEPGQGCFYSLSTFSSNIRNVDLYEYVAWKDGVLPFKDKSLGSIVRRVEKYYNHKVLIEGDRLPTTLISGKLVLSDDIDEVVDYLAKTVEGRATKSEDGSFLIMN